MLLHYLTRINLLIWTIPCIHHLCIILKLFSSQDQRGGFSRGNATYNAVEYFVDLALYDLEQSLLEAALGVSH